MLRRNKRLVRAKDTGPSLGRRRFALFAALAPLAAARSSQAQGNAPAARPVPSGRGVYLDDFTKPGADDDAPALNAAIKASLEGGGPVYLGPRRYRIGSTVTLPSGLTLIGSGAERLRDAEVPGTVLMRTRDCVLFEIKGESFNAGRKLKQSIAIERIAFVGGDFKSDMIQAKAVLRLQIDKCLFSASQGRHLLFWEVFDSRITNTDFESGGTADVPMIELRSGGEYEYTNQVHFVGCRHESYPGTALALTGQNTNEIFIANAKYESAFSLSPAITMDRAAVVYMNGVQIFTAGKKDQQIPCQLRATASSGLIGTLLLEHRGPSRGGARLGSYLAVDRCQAVDLTVYAYDGVDDAGTDGFVRIEGGSKQISIRGLLKGKDSAASRQWKVE